MESASPEKLIWAQPLTSPLIFLSPTEEPLLGDTGAQHLRPHSSPSPAGAARAPREAATRAGNSDPLLPGSHPRQRATRSLLPLRTSEAPRNGGHDTFRRGAPRAPGSSCSRSRAPSRFCQAPAPAGEEPPTRRSGPHRHRPGAQHRPAALGSAGRPLDSAAAPGRGGLGRTRLGVPAPPGAGQGRAGQRPAPSLRRPVSAPCPPARRRRRLRDGPGPRAWPPPTGASDTPRPRDGLLPAPPLWPLPPPGDSRAPLRGSPSPPPAAEARDPRAGGAHAARPTPRQPLAAKPRTPGARRAPSNAAAPPPHVMETSASPPARQWRRRGAGPGAEPRPPPAPCLSRPLPRRPH
ncbi:translation initiation factor IF-2-like [Apus apus]|uniref:translation initiation factor IF-2-like n=1 Tax=Apus apus TaxID=8895 RepID=UPI0021F8C517|nr:translation initiation factor IF-2-like [Apus apus]